MKRQRGTTSYSRRERNFEFMTWVRAGGCIVLEVNPIAFIRRRLPLIEAARLIEIVSVNLTTICRGDIEADHMGARGLSQKADDFTCVSICQQHHIERTDHTGIFRPLNRDEVREWRAVAIERTQAAWSNR
jgi:hypothetical protein